MIYILSLCDQSYHIDDTLPVGIGKNYVDDCHHNCYKCKTSGTEFLTDHVVRYLAGLNLNLVSNS